MSFFQNMSIRSKLLLVSMLTTVVGLMIAAITLYVYELRTYSERLAENYVGLVNAIQPGSATALMFDDPDYAAEILGQLLAIEDVKSASIYYEDGQPFVAFAADGGIDLESAPPVQPPGTTFEGPVLHLYSEIMSEDAMVGTIGLVVELPGARDRAQNYAFLMGAVLLAALFTAFIFSNGLVALISRPIISLLRVTQRVSEEQDYTIRADKTTNDELGDLILSFNAMLEQIEDRDQELEGHRDRLEIEVAERTREIGRLSLAVEQSPSMMVITDAAGLPEYVNPRFTELTGYTLEEALAANPKIMTSGRLEGDGLELLEAAVRDGREWSGEFQNTRKGGDIYWESARVAPVIDEGTGEHHHFVWIKEDITQQKAAERKLRESEERYALAAQGSNDGLWDWDLQNHTVYFSPRWKEMLGHEESEIGDDPDEWFSRVHEEDIDDLRSSLHNHLDGMAPLFIHEFRIKHRDGHYLWVLSRGVSVLDDDGKPHRLAGSQTDITDRKQTEEQLFYDASHDQLTGLSNRGLFTERLQMALDRTKRRPNHKYAVLFLDLDRFKVINDSLGHAAGDQLLIEASARLETCIRKTDLIARLGGDEFAILMEDFDEDGAAIRTAERVHRAISEPFYVNDNEIFTTTSVGIAIGREDYASAEDVVRDADTAMYRAKTNGKAQHVVFDVELHAEALQRLQLENDLRRAVDADEFELYYQPIISVENRHTIGFEALIRWRHPENGIVSPAVFIPIAEETDLISPMGWWIIDTACKQLKDWRDSGIVEDHVTVAVNISGKQFLQVDFCERLRKVVLGTGLPPKNLKLEVTESVIAQNPENVQQILTEIKTIGIQLCIDDFGTGYSSFSYLHRFPFDILKIDRSFVGNIDKDDEASEICQALVAMSHKLDLRVVAEGVEEGTHLDKLKDMDCDMAQGFLMSRPLPADDVEAFMQSEPGVWADAAQLAS